MNSPRHAWRFLWCFGWCAWVLLRARGVFGWYRGCCGAAAVVAQGGARLLPVVYSRGAAGCMVCRGVPAVFVALRARGAHVPVSVARGCMVPWWLYSGCGGRGDRSAAHVRWCGVVSWSRGRVPCCGPLMPSVRGAACGCGRVLAVLPVTRCTRGASEPRGLDPVVPHGARCVVAWWCPPAVVHLRPAGAAAVILSQWSVDLA